MFNVWHNKHGTRNVKRIIHLVKKKKVTFACVSTVQQHCGFRLEGARLRWPKFVMVGAVHRLSPVRPVLSVSP